MLELPASKDFIASEAPVVNEVPIVRYAPT
jgi:hypothetical protein